MDPDFLGRALRWLAVATLVAVAPHAGAQHLFKCGSAFQDRPCESQDIQQRFSHTAGKFSVEQVNADTDKDCADAAARLFPLWQRLNSGEGFDKIKGDIDAQPIERAEKSRMRDVLLALKEFKGSPREVRSELERNCMNYKRQRGLPTERDVARNAQASADAAAAATAAAQRGYSNAAEARARAEEARARAEEARIERARARAARAAGWRSE